MDESFRFSMLRKPTVSLVISGTTKPEDAFVTGRGRKPCGAWRLALMLA
jgi:hypothetical protein